MYVSERNKNENSYIINIVGLFRNVVGTHLKDTSRVVPESCSEFPSPDKCQDLRHILKAATTRRPGCTSVRRTGTRLRRRRNESRRDQTEGSTHTCLHCQSKCSLTAALFRFRRLLLRCCRHKSNRIQ